MVVVDPIGDREEASRETGLDGVESVAGGCLRDLDETRLGVAVEDCAKRRSSESLDSQL
jgi:hypothetical protein